MSLASHDTSHSTAILPFDFSTSQKLSPGTVASHFSIPKHI